MEAKDKDRSLGYQVRASILMPIWVYKKLQLNYLEAISGAEAN